jgi:hypothetical protein
MVVSFDAVLPVLLIMLNKPLSTFHSLMRHLSEPLSNFCHHLFCPQTLGCRPIASLDHFVPEHLANAELVEEVQTGSSKFVKVCC